MVKYLHWCTFKSVYLISSHFSYCKLTGGYIFLLNLVYVVLVHKYKYILYIIVCKIVGKCYNKRKNYIYYIYFNILSKWYKSERQLMIWDGILYFLLASCHAISLLLYVKVQKQEVQCWKTMGWVFKVKCFFIAWFVP